MKRLQKQFIGRGEVKGFRFRQLAANFQAYLYEVVTPGAAVHFEVFRRKVTEAHSVSLPGKFYNVPHTIVYPRSKDFGIWAFTYTSEQKAHDKFNSLSQTGQELKSCKSTGTCSQKAIPVLNGDESKLTVNPL